MILTPELKKMAIAFPVFAELTSEELDKLFSRFETLVKLYSNGKNTQADSEKEKIFLSGLLTNLQDNPNFVRWCIKLLLQLSDNSVSAFFNNVVMGMVVDRNKQIKSFYNKHGIVPPITIVINPTMRCNINCRGCYAYNYRQRGDGDMEYSLLRKVLLQAREIGIRFITLSGGEPLLYKHAFEMFEEFSDMNFLMYTNGTLIDKDVARKLSHLGNVMPGVSVEGYEKETDQRRGKGIFAKTLKAMEYLRENGVLFGISCTPTSVNADIMATEEFFDFWMEQGIYFAWLFTYIPVGKDPDLTLVCSPQQRNKLRKVCHEYRERHPLFLADFWNDGPCVGGCLSASRYLYITSEGIVQPCTFVHFYTHNIREHTIVEILKSPFFEAIRNAQPYSENLLRPCKIIDNPAVLRKIVKECGAKPSYEGAQHIIEDSRVVSFLDKYAEEYKKITDEVWINEYDSGRSFLIPFLGRKNIHTFYADRMKNAPKDIALEGTEKTVKEFHKTI